MNSSISGIVHWKERFFVHSYEADFKGNAKITTIVQYFQESAWKHAREYSIGYDDLKKSEKFWVLSSLAFKMLEYPRWGDEIELVTWSRGAYKLLAIRDFEIYNRNTLQCQGTSSWLILDAINHRPQRFDLSFDEFPRDKDRIAFLDDYLKINLPENLNQGINIKVNYNDLDINCHVNNVKYIEWALNAVPAQYYENFEMNFLKINFLSECLNNDDIFLNFYEDKVESDSFFINAIKEKDKKEVFRFLSKWEKNK